jgi:hypothetical protein
MEKKQKNTNRKNKNKLSINKGNRIILKKMKKLIKIKQK